MRLPPYPEYKSSGVEWLGEVPEHWGVSPLRYLIAQPITDGPHLTPEFVREGIPFLSVDGIQDGELVFTNTRFVSEDDHRSFIRKARPERGDILMGKAASTGKIALVKVDFAFSIWSPLALIRTNRSVADSRFTEYALKSKSAQSQIDVLCTHNTQSNISMNDIPRIVFAIPLALPEQRAIADFLDRETAKIDSLVAKKRTLIERLKEKRTALISRAVTHGLPPAAASKAGLDPHPKLKPSGIDWLGEVPEHWDIGKFSREVRIAEGQADPEIEPYASMLLIAPNHIESGTGRLIARETAAEQAAISGKYVCRAGEVVYSKIRPALAKAVLAPEDCLCSADMYPMTPIGLLHSRYLLRFLLSSQFTAWSVLEADRVAMPKVNRETLNELRLPVPPPIEQKAIADCLDRETAKTDGMVTKVETAIERLQEYRTALITAAVTGKIDVRAAAA